MTRRELILLLGGGALLHTPTGRAQEPGRIYPLGVILREPRDNVSFVALLDGLRQSGFVEGQNLRVEGRFSTRDADGPEVANALAAAGVDAILTGSYRRTRAAQEATRKIPIVAVADDLVLSGLVSSLSHPGGNTTGISILATELDGKRQDLLIGLVPTAHRLAALIDPGVTAPEQLRALADAARVRGIELSTTLPQNLKRSFLRSMRPRNRAPKGSTCWRQDCSTTTSR
jgi:putative ABC transport system substrate-binding protein